jgi:hypothetical protein
LPVFLWTDRDELGIGGLLDSRVRSTPPTAVGSQTSRISAKSTYDFQKRPKPFFRAIAPPGIFYDFEKLRFKTLSLWQELSDSIKIPLTQGPVQLLF